MAGSPFFNFRFAVDFLSKKLEITSPNTPHDHIRASILNEIKIALQDEMLLAYTTQELQGLNRSMEHVKWAVAVRLWNKLVPGTPCIYQRQEPLQSMSNGAAHEGLDFSMGFQISQHSTLASVLEAIEPDSNGAQIAQLPTPQGSQSEAATPMPMPEPSLLGSPPVTPDRRQAAVAERAGVAPQPSPAAIRTPPAAVQQMASPPASNIRRPRGRAELRHRHRSSRQNRVAKVVPRFNKATFVVPFSCKLDARGFKVHRCPPAAACRYCKKHPRLYEDARDASDVEVCRWTRHFGQTPTYDKLSVGEIPWPRGANAPRHYCQEGLWAELTKTLGFDFQMKRERGRAYPAPATVLLVELRDSGYTRADKWCAMAFIQRLAAKVAKYPGVVSHAQVAKDILYDRLFRDWLVIQEEVVRDVNRYNEKEAASSVIELDSE